MIFLAVACFRSVSQEEKIYRSVRLDTVTILASEDFDIRRFIEQTVDDTTFLRAFVDLRNTSHRIFSEAMVLNRQNNERATRKIEARQINQANGMWVERLSEKSTGKLYDRKGNHRYYTMEMYDHVFIPKDTQSVSSAVSRPTTDVNRKKGKTERHKEQIKLFMFNPGTDIGSAPLIGDRLSIFDDDLVAYYDYKISMHNFNGVSCYVFSCTAKPDFAKRKTVVKELVTYFDATTMEVLKRDYHLVAHTIAFDFDVKIKVELARTKDVLLPVKITYAGFWNIPFKMRESIFFVHEIAL